MSWALDVAARTLCQEVRGEPMAGQQAVAWVIKNRLKSKRWGTSLASVCLWHAQFSGWWCPRGNPGQLYYDPNFAYACNLPDTDPMLQQMQALMSSVMNSDTDPTAGALFYYANSMPTPPSWASTMRFLGQFGHQSFFTDQPASPVMGA